MTAPAGAVNAWSCPVCRRDTVAVHVDEGTTPMFLACRATPKCRGDAVSAGYPPPQVGLDRFVEWEWRRATTTELKRWRRTNPEMFQHCTMGGLVLSPLTDRGRALLR